VPLSRTHATFFPPRSWDAAICIQPPTTFARAFTYSSYLCMRKNETSLDAWLIILFRHIPLDARSRRRSCARLRFIFLHLLPHARARLFGITYDRRRHISPCYSLFSSLLRLSNRSLNEPVPSLTTAVTLSSSSVALATPRTPTTICMSIRPLWSDPLPNSPLPFRHGRHFEGSRLSVQV
jgi:hypothetical protein